LVGVMTRDMIANRIWVLKYQQSHLHITMICLRLNLLSFLGES
jgi:hypothetical protein